MFIPILVWGEGFAVLASIVTCFQATVLDECLLVSRRTVNGGIVFQRNSGRERN